MGNDCSCILVIATHAQYFSAQKSSILWWCLGDLLFGIFNLVILIGSIWARSLVISDCVVWRAFLWSRRIRYFYFGTRKLHIRLFLSAYHDACWVPWKYGDLRNYDEAIKKKKKDKSTACITPEHNMLKWYATPARQKKLQVAVVRFMQSIVRGKSCKSLPCKNFFFTVFGTVLFELPH
jgi:hypothetical protein